MSKAFDGNPNSNIKKIYISPMDGNRIKYSIFFKNQTSSCKNILNELGTFESLRLCCEKYRVSKDVVDQIKIYEKEDYLNHFLLEYIKLAANFSSNPNALTNIENEGVKISLDEAQKTMDKTGQCIAFVAYIQKPKLGKVILHNIGEWVIKACTSLPEYVKFNFYQMPINETYNTQGNILELIAQEPHTTSGD